MAWQRSPWAEIDAFLSRQPLTLRTTHHDAFDLNGGRIGLWWHGYGGHIELAHEHGTYIARLPHELVDGALAPLFAPGLFQETRAPCLQATTRVPGEIVRLLAAVLPPLLVAAGARGGGGKRRTGEEDDGEEGFVPLQRTGAWWRCAYDYGDAR